MKNKLLAILSVISAVSAGIIAVNGGDYFWPAVLAIFAVSSID